MNYYEILGISPQATKAEIKAAYYRLSKELHPDKLPPDTPQLARKTVEDKYKQINAAYSCLIDPEQRREYDQQVCPPSTTYYSSHQPPSNNYSPPPPHPTWLDETQIRRAAETLKNRIEKIEVEAEQRYLQKIQWREQELLRAIKSINYQGSLDKIELIPEKSQSISQGIVISLLGCFILLFIRHYLLSFLGIIIIFVGFFKIVYGSQMPVSYHQKVLRVKKLYREFREIQSQAFHQKNQEIFQAKNEIAQRIHHFQKIPLSSLTQDFISRLSGEDQVLLLVALQNNKERLNQEAQEMVAVALGIGAFAALLGLNFLFRVD